MHTGQVFLSCSFGLFCHFYFGIFLICRKLFKSDFYQFDTLFINAINCCHLLSSLFHFDLGPTMLGLGFLFLFSLDSTQTGVEHGSQLTRPVGESGLAWLPRTAPQGRNGFAF